MIEYEQLCDGLVRGVGDIAVAQSRILELEDNSEFHHQCRFILETSTQSPAQMVALRCLHSLMTKYWNNYDHELRNGLRSFTMNYLANRVDSLINFNVIQLTKCICRAAKLGWFDTDEARTIVDDTRTLMGMSIKHYSVGLQLLNNLVHEFDRSIPGKPLTSHRKTAVSFRDQCLYQIFCLAFETLKQIKSNGTITLAEGPYSLTDEEQSVIIKLCLNVNVTCLSFDFIGTNPEDSQEDVGTVQVPGVWRDLISEVANLTLYFEFHKQMASIGQFDTSCLALKVLVQMSSIRRSLFKDEKQRNAFLNVLISGIERILRESIGLNDQDNYHEFCRLLGRLKANYQLSELVKTISFASWLELTGTFTIASFDSWDSCMNSIHYLLALWGRVVSALPYLRREEDEAKVTMLKGCIMTILDKYMNVMLSSVETVVGSYGAVADPLEDTGSLDEAMDRLPVLARLSYTNTGEFLAGQFNILIQHFIEGVQMRNQQGLNVTTDVSNGLKIVEGKLAWLVRMVSAIIGGARAQDSKGEDEQNNLIIDGRLCNYIFILVGYINDIYNQQANQNKNDIDLVDEKLEFAILGFFKSFKKVYLLESMSESSRRYVEGAPISSSGSLLGLALRTMKGDTSLLNTLDIDGNENGGKESSIKTIYEAMEQQFSSSNLVMNLIIEKVCNDIKFWNDDDSILQMTLEVFVDLVSSYNAGKALLKLDNINFLVNNHEGDHLPFLAYDNNNKYRIRFYQALGRLVFTSSEDLDNMLDTFIAPNLDMINQLSNITDFRSIEDPNEALGVRTAVIGILRDLRGITEATYNKRTYNLLFDSLYPAAFPLFGNIAECYFDDPEVMIALMKFLQEFVANKAQRIQFENSNANGILLFRETSKIVCSYGSRILHLPTKSDIYKEKYKGIRSMLNVLIAVLTGGYVNFGVFDLYEDPALQNVLDVSLQLCLQIPIEDVMEHMKLCRAYFGCIEVFFRSHLDVLSRLDADVFLQFVKANHEGLQTTGRFFYVYIIHLFLYLRHTRHPLTILIISLLSIYSLRSVYIDASVLSSCASTIDHIASYIFLNSSRNKPTAVAIQAHMASDPTCIGALLTTLFNSLLFGPQGHWPITRPILSLMLIAEDTFAEYQNQLMSTQTPENQQKLSNEFTKLTDDMQVSTSSITFITRITILRLL